MYIMGATSLVLPVLSTESVIYHPCKNVLSAKSIDSLLVSVDSQITSIIYRYGLGQSCNSWSTVILHSFYLVNNTGREFGITPVYTLTMKETLKDLHQFLINQNLSTTKTQSRFDFHSGDQQNLQLKMREIHGMSMGMSMSC